MKQTGITFLITLFSIFTFSAQAQTLKELAGIDEKYQACLDKGDMMLNCSQDYYSQMDSLLNVAYNKLRRPMNQDERAVLKSEQLKWLGKRDAQFKKIDKEYSSFGGNDGIMMVTNAKALFVRKRVEELIRKLENS